MQDVAAELFLAALQFKDICILHALPCLGFCWQPTAGVFVRVLKGHAEGSHITLLAWLLEAGCPVDWPTALAAADGDPALSPVVKALLQERSMLS